MAIYRNVLQYNLPNGGIAENVWYASIINGETADQDDLVTDIGNQVLRIITPWLAQMAINVVCTLVRVYVLDPLTGIATPVGVHTLNVTGGGTVQALPAAVSVKLSQYIQGRSRPFGPYLAGPDEAGALNNGLISTGMQSAAVAVGLESTQVETMALTGLAYRPRVYSFKDKSMYSLENAAIEVNDVFDYQRRRKQGVGA